MCVSAEEALTYPDVQDACFAFLEALFESHTPRMAQADPKVFTALLTTLNRGVTLSDTNKASPCATALESLFDVRNDLATKRNPPPALKLLDAHFAHNEALLNDLVSDLFHMIFFEVAKSDRWVWMRPLHGLIFAMPEAFKRYQQRFLESQHPDMHKRVTELFAILMNSIKPDCTPTAKEHFQTELLAFYMKCSKFIRPIM